MVALSLALPMVGGCKSGGGKALGALVARAAVSVAAAAISEGIRRKRGRRRDPDADYVDEPGRLAVEEPFEVYELPMVVQPPREPLPVAYDLSPDELTCDADAECVRVESPACTCDAGGRAVAAVGLHADSVATRLGRDATCDGGPLDATCAGEVRCHRGLCRIFAPRPVEVTEPPAESVPPPPEAPPSSVPEGY